jgi:hypothetical protein
MFFLQNDLLVVDAEKKKLVTETTKKYLSLGCSAPAEFFLLPIHTCFGSRMMSLPFALSTTCFFLLFPRSLELSVASLAQFPCLIEPFPRLMEPFPCLMEPFPHSYEPFSVSD